MTQEEDSMAQELIETTKEKYSEILQFCENEEQQDKVIQELALFETVISQVNQIFKETLYQEDISVFGTASDETLEALVISFTKEFISKSKEGQELAGLPDLALVVSWVNEIHTNVAAQLFKEDFVNEVIAPSYDSISEAIIEISQNDIEDTISETAETEETETQIQNLTEEK